MMAECIKNGEALPERNVNFCGHECRNRERFTCKYYSHIFVDGTNCLLLRKPRNVRALLGLETKQ